MASLLAFHYPELFRGGFFFYGCNYYRDLAVPGEPDTIWQARFRRPERLKSLRQDHGFVLLTGEKDFNRPQTKAIYDAMREDGFRHVTYLEIPGADHYYGIHAEWLARGLESLDER